MKKEMAVLAGVFLKIKPQADASPAAWDTWTAGVRSVYEQASKHGYSDLPEWLKLTGHSA